MDQSMCCEEETGSMKLNDDLVMEIISHLPLKLAVQCKLVSKNLNHWISDAKFSHTLFQHQKVNTLFFPIQSGGASVIRRELQRIFRNGRLIVPTIQHQTTSPFRFRVISVCNGLLLLDFIELGTFCVFNPVTGSHQLIPLPQHYRHMRCGQAGLFVDYPVSDQYKLITVEWLDQGKGYKFHLLSSSSSSSSGLWHEFQINNDSKPVHLHDSLHWLTATGRILSFDIKRQEATILDPPDLLNIHHNRKGRRGPRIIYSSNEWLVKVQGQLTLVCTHHKSSVIVAYDCQSRNWRVSPILDQCIRTVLPTCINGKQVLFLVADGYLYEYDSHMNTYKKVAVYREEYGFPSAMYPFKPSLAPVHETLISTTVDAKHLPGITAILDTLKRCITQGIEAHDLFVF